mgnify:FL=1
METKAEILAKVSGIIAKQLKVDETEIKLEKSLIDDLNADSLDIVELVMSMEDEFGFEIPDSDAEKLRTVGDAVDYIAANGG